MFRLTSKSRIGLGPAKRQMHSTEIVPGVYFTVHDMDFPQVMGPLQVVAGYEGPCRNLKDQAFCPAFGFWTVIA